MIAVPAASRSAPCCRRSSCSAPPSLVLVLDLAAAARPRKAHLGGVRAGRHLIGALLAPLGALGHATGARFRDMVVLDNYALFFDLVICYAAALVVLLSMDYLRRRAERVGGVLRARALRDRRHDAAGLGRRPHRRVPGPRAHVALALRAGRTLQARLASGEASHEVLPARRVRLVLPRSTASRCSTAPPARRTSTASRPRPAARRATRCRSPASGSCWSASASRSPRCRSTCGRPTSTRERPPAITALIATGSKAAAFAALIRRAGGGAAQRRRPTGTALLWVIAAVTMTRGQRGGDRPVEPQAHAGVLVDRARGLHAGRRWWPAAPAGAGAVLFYLLAYTFTTAGAFGVIAPLRAGRRGGGRGRATTPALRGAIRCWRRRSASSCSR